MFVCVCVCARALVSALCVLARSSVLKSNVYTVILCVLWWWWGGVGGGGERRAYSWECTLFVCTFACMCGCDSVRSFADSYVLTYISLDGLLRS